TALEDRLARDLIRARLEAVTKELPRFRGSDKDAKGQPGQKEQEAEKYFQQLLKDEPALKLYTMPEPKSQLEMTRDLERKTDAKLTAALGPLMELERKDFFGTDERRFAEQFA